MKLTKYTPSKTQFAYTVQRLFNEDVTENVELLESFPMDLIRYFDKAEEVLKTDEVYRARLEFEKAFNYLSNLDECTDDEIYELIDKIKELGSDPKTMNDFAMFHDIPMWAQLEDMSCVDLMEEIEAV